MTPFPRLAPNLLCGMVSLALSCIVRGEGPSPLTTGVSPIPVPPPKKLPVLPGLGLPKSVKAVSRPDPAEIQRLTPRLQIWRATGLVPQTPSRHHDVLEYVYVPDGERATVLLQFDRRAAGERITVVPAGGLVLSSPEPSVTVSTNGECIVTVQLAEGVSRSHIIFYCGAVKTILPIARASLAKVVQQEAATGRIP